MVPHVKAYLERSGSTPLEVQIHDHASRLLSSHIERISSLWVFLDNPPNLHKIARHFPKPALLLQTMDLHVTNGGQSTLCLPSTFFETFLSSVRVLAAHGAILFPGPSKLSQLTKFPLETRFDTVSSIGLLDILEELSLLQLLEVKLDWTNQHGRISGNRIVTLSRLEEVTITMDDSFGVGLASPTLPALCLPSVRRINMRLFGIFYVLSIPILPPSFEERPPGLSATPEVLFTFHSKINVDIEFFGLYQSQLTLSINSVAPYFFRATTFGSVRKLHVHFQRPIRYLLSFFSMLRALGRLECLETEQNTIRSLSHWIDWYDQTELCPALPR